MSLESPRLSGRVGEPLRKVTAFVTRNRCGRTELLVFRHPTAGVQLPAGTVDVGESPEAAVLREVTEETGLKGCTLVGLLDVVCTDLPERQRVVLASDGGPIRRGMTVTVRQVGSEYTDVDYETHDYATTPPTVLTVDHARLSNRHLGVRLTRDLFHLDFRGATPERWKQRADGHVFEPFWTPLTPRPQLVNGQQAWLDMVYDQLIRGF